MAYSWTEVDGNPTIDRISLNHLGMGSPNKRLWVLRVMYLICCSTGHRICLERGWTWTKREWDTDEWQRAFYFPSFSVSTWQGYFGLNTIPVRKSSLFFPALPPAIPGIINQYLRITGGLRTTIVSNFGNLSFFFHFFFFLEKWINTWQFENKI